MYRESLLRSHYKLSSCDTFSWSWWPLQLETLLNIQVFYRKFLHRWSWVIYMQYHLFSSSLVSPRFVRNVLSFAQQNLYFLLVIMISCDVVARSNDSTCSTWLVCCFWNCRPFAHFSLPPPRPVLPLLVWSFGSVPELVCYLYPCSQIVYSDDIYAFAALKTSGIPQDSVLGPFFTIYITSL